MSERNFHMRLKSTYQGTENGVASLDVEQRIGGEWKPLVLALTTPGFDIFVYTILTCQHMYFRVNCAERGLLLEHTEGEITVGAAEDWAIETLRVAFTGKLREGQPQAQDIDHIVSRMKQCPVSRNLRDIADAESRIRLE